MSKICNPDSCTTIGVLQLQVDGLMQTIDSQKETNIELASKVMDDHKFAELGRLAINTEICDYDFGCSGRCSICSDRDFCEKRAELVAEVKHKESKCPNCDGRGFSETLGGHAGGVDCYRCKGTGLVAEVQK